MYLHFGYKLWTTENYGTTRIYLTEWNFSKMTATIKRESQSSSALCIFPILISARAYRNYTTEVFRLNIEYKNQPVMGWTVGTSCIFSRVKFWLRSSATALIELRGDSEVSRVGHVGDTPPSAAYLVSGDWAGFVLWLLMFWHGIQQLLISKLKSTKQHQWIAVSGAESPVGGALEVN